MAFSIHELRSHKYTPTITLSLSQRRYSIKLMKSVGCSKISESTGGLRDAVNTVLWYAQHSNSMMARLLGSSYTVDTLLFYGTSTVVLLAASNPQQTRPARLPLFGKSICKPT